MVSFVCDYCQETLKKPKLKQHTLKCRNYQFSCVDCFKTFTNDYQSHTSCITEETKFHKTYKAKDGKNSESLKDVEGLKNDGNVKEAQNVKKAQNSKVSQKIDLLDQINQQHKSYTIPESKFMDTLKHILQKPRSFNKLKKKLEKKQLLDKFMQLEFKLVDGKIQLE